MGYITPPTVARNCSECGKQFRQHLACEWGYTSMGKMYCTYTCMRIAQKRQYRDVKELNDQYDARKKKRQQRVNQKRRDKKK